MSSSEPGGRQAPDLDDPVFQFIAGIIELAYGKGPGDAPPVADPAEFRSSVERLLAAKPAMTRDPSMTAEEQAGRLVEAAWESEDEGGPVLAVDALRLWPGCADAYTYLGVSAGEEVSLAIPLFTLGLMAAYESLGQDAFDTHAGNFWTRSETQPFMRALAELARANREAGALDVAAAHYQEMLRLNPADHQGARYELLGILLEMGDQDAAERLLTVYGDDATPGFAYAAALLDFQRSGDTPASRDTLQQALAASPRVAEFLSGARPFPAEGDIAFDPGSDGEAAIFAELLAPAWEATDGAVEWLRANPPAAAPAKVVAAPAKEKRSGPRGV